MTYKEEIKSLLTQLAAANSELVRKQERDSQYSNVCCKLSAKENEVAQLRQRLVEKDAEIERLKTVPMKYRRMEFNAQLHCENNELRELLAASQARELQLREALRKIADLRNLGKIEAEVVAHRDGDMLAPECTYMVCDNCDYHTHPE